MAKFSIPESVAEINILKLNGDVSTERYATLDQYFDALVRSNVQNARKTYKAHGETTIENGKYITWITVVAKKDEALE